MGEFIMGSHMLCKVIKYTKEDGNPGKMCMLKAPNGEGERLRDKLGWNLEKYPSLTDEEKEELVPMWNDMSDKYYMDWDDALGYFETMHTTFNYPEHSWTSVRNHGKGFFELRITEDQGD